jgi:arylsulfatase
MYFVHTGLYEPTVHVPLITYFPGAERQGREVRDVVESVDIMPTVLEYFRVAAPPDIRGRSLWPLIRGAVAPERVAFVEHAGKNLVALRSERYKYIRHLRTNHLQPSYPFQAGKEELYDLHEDPHELNNLVTVRPEVARVFRLAYEERHKARQNRTAGSAEVDKETLEVLRSLGYVR